MAGIGQGFQSTAQFDFLRQQALAARAIFVGFIGKSGAHGVALPLKFLMKPRIREWPEFAPLL